MITLLLMVCAVSSALCSEYVAHCERQRVKSHAIIRSKFILTQLKSHKGSHNVRRLFATTYTNGTGMAHSQEEENVFRKLK